ncbi:MAG: hypothetical protein LLG16_03850 [Euryarchaeota archaeon]|nr:hypothetical protein [Euryarchaeota archaeon]
MRPANKSGDFVSMGNAIGGLSGNMEGAFRAEIVLELALSDPGGPHDVWWVIGDIVLEVNRFGS